MNRRKFLSGASTSVAVLSGCIGILSSNGSNSRKIGDGATYEGVEFTPVEYILADEIGIDYDVNTTTESADQGAIFVLTRVRVVHNGDSAQPFPPNSSGRDTVDNLYDGETIFAGISLSGAVENYIVDGVKLPRYDVSLGDKYPGAEAGGWILTKAAQNFDPSKLELRVTWNQQIVGDEGETTHTWSYTDEAEIEIGDISENEDNSTTVEM